MDRLGCHDDDKRWWWLCYNKDFWLVSWLSNGVVMRQWMDKYYYVQAVFCGEGDMANLDEVFYE
jgi:hypothetical protein